MQKPILGALIALFVAANASPRDMTPGESDKGRPPTHVQLTDEQLMYLNNYCGKRSWAIFLCRVLGYFHGRHNADITLEDLRPRAAKHCGLPSDAVWESFLGVKKYQKYLTEVNRKKISKVLFGHEDATWVQLLNRIEWLRIKREQNEISMRVQGDQGGRLFCSRPGLEIRLYYRHE